MNTGDARKPWRPAPPAYMRVKPTLRVWNGIRPSGRCSSPLAQVDRGAVQARRRHKAEREGLARL